MANRVPRVVITTDLYGQPVDVIQMRRLTDQYGFVWISDSAEALGAAIHGRHAGHGADFVVMSFNGNKIITTSGGGALASNNELAIKRARFLATQAREPAPHYEHRVIGYNYRLSNICAALGVGQLTYLAARVKSRRQIFEHYRSLLAELDGIHFHEEATGSFSNRWLTTLEIDPARAGFDGEQARLALEAADIESRPLWKPMHLQPAYHGCRVLGGSVATCAFERGLCLPSGSAMDDASVERVADIILRLAK